MCSRISQDNQSVQWKEKPTITVLELEGDRPIQVNWLGHIRDDNPVILEMFEVFVPLVTSMTHHDVEVVFPEPVTLVGRCREIPGVPTGVGMFLVTCNLNLRGFQERWPTIVGGSKMIIKYPGKE